MEMFTGTGSRVRFEGLTVVIGGISFLRGIQNALITNCHGLVLVSSSARVTSAKFQPKLLYGHRDIETHCIDQTPRTPGSGKKNAKHQSLDLVPVQRILCN